LINGNGALRNIAYSRDRIPRKDFTTNCKKLEDRVSEADLQQFLKLLPSGQGEKLKLSLEPVLDNLVWTSLDAVNALSDALEEKGIELNPERFEELLSRFLESSFESDYITQQVNEHLTDLARDFLSSSVADQK
jgi:acyl carrier protein